MTTRHRIIDTFTGAFAIILGPRDAMRTTWLSGESTKWLAASQLDRRLLPDLTARLKRYFAGAEIDFDDVPLPLTSAEFYRRCWKACRRIPRGETCSYADLARAAGSPKAVRAAGQAMRNNPLPIIIPCHRVIASGGNLHGFFGSCDQYSDGLHVKRALLRMEGAHAAGRDESELRLADAV